MASLEEILGDKNDLTPRKTTSLKSKQITNYNSVMKISLLSYLFIALFSFNLSNIDKRRSIKTNAVLMAIRLHATTTKSAFVKTSNSNNTAFFKLINPFNKPTKARNATHLLTINNRDADAILASYRSLTFGNLHEHPNELAILNISQLKAQAIIPPSIKWRV